MNKTISQIKTNLLEQFQTQGYIEYKQLFTRDEAQALIKNIQAAETIDGVSALNKGSMMFYSGVYAKSPALQEIVSQPRVINLLKQIIGPNFWVRWDQAVAKGSGAGVFPWHQDNAYNSLKDEHYQLWIALTKSTGNNGGLWLVPKHQNKVLPHDKVGNHMVFCGEPENPILIEAEPGDAILFSSLTLHSTTPNQTQDTRWAYVIEYMSCEDFDPTLVPPYFMVARNGQADPKFVYWYKGRWNPLNHLKYWRKYFSLFKNWMFKLKTKGSS